MAKPSHPTRRGFFDQPSWRWKRASDLTARRQRVTRADDDWIRLAKGYLVANEASPGRRRRCRGEHASVEAAHHLWQSDQPHRRWLLEAAVVAGESEDQVAARCGLEPSIVQTYEALFYDVGSMLRFPDWISIYVAGRGLPTLLRENYPERIWKLFAYRGGSRILDIVIAVTTGQPLPEWFRAQSGKDSYTEARTRLSAKLAIESLLADTPARIAELIRIAEAAAELNAGYGDGSATDSETLRSMQHMWDMFSRGSRRTARRRRKARPAAPRNPIDALGEFIRGAHI